MPSAPDDDGEDSPNSVSSADAGSRLVISVATDGPVEASA